MFRRTTSQTLMAVSIAVTVLSAPVAYGQSTVYVDRDAPGTNTGLSWPDAFRDLQVGLAYAAGHPSVQEIRVAAGTYKPTPGIQDLNATFQLRDGVALLGGFAGYGQPDPDARDFVTYPTILSGDLTNNDGSDPIVDHANSYHVVTGNGTNATAILDGFTISGGNNPDGSVNYGTGGGMINMGGSPTLRNCVFFRNGSTSAWFGGAVANLNAAPTFVNCAFVRNRAGDGAAIYNDNAHPILAGCVFSGNTANQYGGAISNWDSSPTLTNCTFSGNTATGSFHQGDAMYSGGWTNPRATNCIFWGAATPTGAQLLMASGTPSVDYCCVRGWNATWGGNGNFGSDPLFVDADGADNIAGTLDDDLRLQPASPCINAGTDTAPFLPATDLTGGARIRHCRVDIGAYETDTFAADCNANGTADTCDIEQGTSTDCNGNDTPDDCEPPTDCNANGTLDICDLAAGTDHDLNGNGILDGCDIAAGTSADADSDGVPDESVVFVDADATGASNGTSWVNAYTDLQTALSYAVNHNALVAQVRVAAGTYRPGAGRYSSFALRNGLALMGGYAGGGTPDPNARDFQFHETILSGDVLGDDVGTNGRTENCFQVVVARPSTDVIPQYVDATAVLDGFTITGGNADGTTEASWGGGLYCEYGTPTIRDCTFRANSAYWDGGGLCSFRRAPALERCTFIDNWAGHDGGGLCIRDGTTALTDCTFDGNTAGNAGGGAFIDAFWGATSATLTRCTFIDNAAAPDTGFGGGLWSGGAATLVNCVFGRNAAYAGGGMYNAWATATLVNCTFSGNAVADVGGGLLSDGAQSVVTLANSIFWANEGAGGLEEAVQLYAHAGSLTVRYCDIQGLTPALAGAGSLDADPLFVDAANGDYHLQAGSPCIDRGDNDAADLPMADYEGDARVQRCRVDLGADEAAFSGDCNANGTPDGCDVAAGTSRDCDSNGIPDECGVDCNLNGTPDGCELASGSSADCNADGIPDDCDIAAGSSPDANGDGIPDECTAAILYVDHAAGGTNHGTSWADAYTELFPALAIAQRSGSAVSQIWVAEGTYHPSADGDPTASFRLRNNLAIYGGFPGGGAGPADRDPTVYLTVLSGDLAENDTTTGDTDDNSYHVVLAEGADATAVLDGFVISGGNAVVEPCTVGGGVLVDGGSPTIANCVFSTNRAALGGGMYLLDGTPHMVNCTFRGNAATYRGGALYTEDANPVVVNSVFSGNTAEASGGALYHANLSAPQLINCTIVHNEASLGGGVFDGYGSTVKIVNCILWGNRAGGGPMEVTQLDGAAPVISYSCVQGWSGELRGLGNTGDDPQFMDADGPDDISGNADDDLWLSVESTSIDAGSNGALPPDWVDLDGDSDPAERTPLDLDGRPRFFDDPQTIDTGVADPPLYPVVVDRGAYEYQPDCNRNHVFDDDDIAAGTSFDCQPNGGPDECDLAPPTWSTVFPLDTYPRWSGFTSDGYHWGWGHPLGWGSHNQDPEWGYTGSYFCNYNYAGDYENSLSSTAYLKTTAIDCSAVSHAELRFWRWLGVDASPGDNADVQVSNNGTEWTTLWTNPSSPIADTAWTLVAFDISAVADHQPTVYIRWGMGPTDAAVTYPGWNIDDVEIRGRVSASSQDCDTNGVPDECQPDCNTNGVADACDLVAGTSADCSGNGIPDECEGFIKGDTDYDGSVTPADWASFAECLTGPCDSAAAPCTPALYTEPCCRTADTDDDGDVDLLDFAAFQWLGAAPPLAALTAAAPPDQGTLWRTAGNVIRLTFDRDLTLPVPGQLLLQPLLDDGLFGADLAADFDVTVENDAQDRPRVLRIGEAWTAVTHRTLVALRNLGDWSAADVFEVQYVVMMGDVDHNGYVLNADAGAVYAHVSVEPVADDCPWDVDGDGYVKNLDASALQPYISPIPAPPRPSGH